MRFRVKLILAAISTAVVGGVLRTAFIDTVVWSRSALLLIAGAYAAAVGVTYLSDALGSRIWKPTRETVRQTAARKEALTGAVAMAAMFSMYGWTSSVVSGKRLTLTSLLINLSFFLVGAVAIFALYRHLSTRSSPD